ncbi:hypothetical protein BT69DRAFT_1271822, partial [Atractiella rhizophila]
MNNKRKASNSKRKPKERGPWRAKRPNPPPWRTREELDRDLTAYETFARQNASFNQELEDRFIPCRAGDRLRLWRGVDNFSHLLLDMPVFRAIAYAANETSLTESTWNSYGSALAKWNDFCNKFCIPFEDRFPIKSQQHLVSFCLWATGPPDIYPQAFRPLTTIGTQTLENYISSLRSWHDLHGAPWPGEKDKPVVLTKWLRGISNIMGQSHKKEPRAPVSQEMMVSLERNLDLSNPFDACVWAAAVT